LAHIWAEHSRRKELKNPVTYLGEDKEHLVLFAKEYIKTHPEIDYLIFGHRHILLDLMLTENNRMIIIGDWMKHFSYAVFDNTELRIEEVVIPSLT